MTTSRGTEGFTLIEALVALAILAVTAVSLLAATEAHVARLDGLETRALARIAAENLIVELELRESADEVRTNILGHDFELLAERSPTPDPDLERIDVTVTEPASGSRFGGFIGFVESGGQP